MPETYEEALMIQRMQEYERAVRAITSTVNPEQVGAVRASLGAFVESMCRDAYQRGYEVGFLAGRAE